MRQIALDTETTGLLVHEGHRIIEIGCVEIIDRKITGNFYHTYINPYRDIDVSAKDVTGLNEIFLESKPRFSDVINDFFNFLDNSYNIIIHNADFDIGFINNELRISNFKFKDFRKYFKIFDTLEYSRKKSSGKSNSLDALCKRYNIDCTDRFFHGALIDAELLARVYLSITSDQNFISYQNSILNVNRFLCDLNIEALKINTQDFKKHLKYIRNIKQNVL